MYLDVYWLSEKLFQKIVTAEQAIYKIPDDAMVNSDIEDLEQICSQRHTISDLPDIILVGKVRS